MHPRRIAAFLLGAWLAGSLLVLIVCFGNLASVDEAMSIANTDAQRILAHVGSDNARMLLRALVAAGNSRLLSGWELAQAPLGILLVLMLFVERPTRLLAVLAAVMLLLVGFEHVLLTPEIDWLSQALAFAREGAALTQRARLHTMHHIYGIVEGMKLLFGCVLALILFVMRGGRRSHRPTTVRPDDLIERRTAAH
jgi:hypothetical protein